MRPLGCCVIVWLDIARCAPVVTHDAVEIIDLSGGFQRAGDLDAFVYVITTVEQFIHVHADTYAELWPGFLADGRDDFLQET
ncbi:hypothetical protein D3C85_1727290 [compost metagenome]